MTPQASLQQAIHEDVALGPYDPVWPALFETERQRLATLFTGQLLDIQHIGSTAMPGMPAKPIIDILAGVTSMAVADALVGPLLASSYTTSAEFNASLRDRRWFMRWDHGRRTHHLHVVVLGDTEWRRRLYFRDCLRADPALAQRYAVLKQELAAQHVSDREAYTAAKTAFVLAVVAEV